MKQPHRIFTWTLLVLLIAFTAPAHAEFTLSTGIRINQAADDFVDGQEGTEFTVPLGVFYTGDTLSLGVQSAFSSARVTGGEADEADISGFTDTMLTSSYTVYGLPFVLSGGLSLNLPTGDEQLSQEESQATIGDGNDLFGVTTFGEGVNVGVNVSIMKQLGKFMLGVNSLYVYKGEYDPTAETPDDTKDPGDQILVAGLNMWRISDAWLITMLGTYSYFLEDRVDGAKDFQEGGTFTVGGALNYAGNPFSFSLSGQAVFSQKDKELVDGSLREEPENSANTTFAGVLDVTYVLSPTLMLQIFGDIRHYTESRRTDTFTELPYAAQRTRYSTGPGIRIKLNDSVSCSILAKYVFVEMGKDIFSPIDTIFEGVDIKTDLTVIF